MIPLPIDPILPDIVGSLRKAGAVVVVAAPGAGKTTRVPPAILEAGLPGATHPNLVMLQPRRVAARAAAHRIAQERGWALGDQVGYQVRFEKRMTPTTRLRVLTEGILTRQIMDDPSLDGIGCVILDEFHERSIHTDLCIALLKEIRQSLRDDLLLVVMSATLSAEPVARFLGECPVVRSEGRLFPIEISYTSPTAGKLPERAADAVIDALGTREDGDLLIFLPGAEEIRRTMRLLEARVDGMDLLPLYGGLPFEQQVRALTPGSRRRIILATNIAETSLTIEGVTTVIDSGFARVAGYDPQRGMDRLELKRISKASADQRAGRAGRMGPGRCVRLWTARQQDELDDFELPEIRRVDLCGVALLLHAWGQADPRKFGWFEPPPEQMLASAEQLLEMLGAMDGSRITDLGRRLLSLPVHPRIGRLLLAAADGGRAEEGAAMAAILEEKDFVRASSRESTCRLADAQSQSDLLVRMDLLAQDRLDGIDRHLARQVMRTRDQLARIAQRISPRKAKRAGDDDELLRWPLLAYPDRVARRRATDPMSAVMVGGGGIRISPDCVVRQGEFFVALDARHDERDPARQATVRMASQIQIQWLEEMFPQSIRRQRELVFDESRQRVVGCGTVWYRDLLLREDREAPVDPQQAGEVLAKALAPRARQIVESDQKAAAWLARARFLARSMPEQNWPEFNDATLSEIITQASCGKRSLADVKTNSFSHLLQSYLPHPLPRAMDELAPETIIVPSGSRIRLDYESGRPVLAVRLQEIFGWTETPRLASGRVPVLLHILGPNYRPVQITDDLHSFWKNTYAQVRKDLRVHYPRHSWPDDPLTAAPQAKGGRKR